MYGGALEPSRSPDPTMGATMGAYCLRALIPRHTAQAGEVLKVRWSDYYGAAIFGDRREIACIPHTGSWLEVAGTAETTHRRVNLLLPGDVIRHTHSVLLGDRFELPGGRRVGLRHLVGFTLQLVQDPRRPSPVAYDLLERAGRDLADSVTV